MSLFNTFLAPTPPKIFAQPWLSLNWTKLSLVIRGSMRTEEWQQFICGNNQMYCKWARYWWNNLISIYDCWVLKKFDAQPYYKLPRVIKKPKTLIYSHVAVIDSKRNVTCLLREKLGQWCFWRHSMLSPHSCWKLNSDSGVLVVFWSCFS